MRLKKPYVMLFGINIIVGILIYLTLITQQLTNHYDGLWSASLYKAGRWEVSIGRWFWPVLDRLREGYAADPFNSYFAILLFAAGNLLIADIFCMVGDMKAYLVNAMVLSSTTISAFLSYRYMSPTFGLSYLFAIAAVWIIQKGKTWKKLVCSIVFICLMLGLYQANIGCTCFLAATLILLLCLEGNNFKEVLKFILEMGCSVLVACIIYKMSWDFISWEFGITAADYNGANHVSVGMIAIKLPAQIFAACLKFYDYFFKGIYKFSIFQSPYIYGVVFFLFFGVLLSGGYRILKKKSWSLLVIYIFGIATLPVACNVSMLLAPEAGFMIQQTCAMAIFIPVMFCLFDKIIQKIERNHLLKGILLGMAIFILYGNIYMTAIDLEVMYEGKKASETVMSHVVQTLIDKNLYSNEKQYFFIGRISENPMFWTTDFWNSANAYARYGQFSTGADLIRMSYGGIMRDMGIRLAVGSNDLYESFIAENKIADMPIYPAEGSILDRGGVCNC